MENPHILKCTHSTNDDAYAFALKGANHGFGVIAATQDRGKGRIGKGWISPPETGLYCSIVLRPKLSFDDFPKLTLTAGLAVCLTVERLLPDFPFGLKWPNDLYCIGKKCGGILVEASTPGTDAEGAFVVVGLGLNVNTARDAFPDTLRQQVTSLYMLSDRYFAIRDIYHDFHRNLLDLVALQEVQGFAPVLSKWCKRDILLGKDMHWLNKDRKVITATALGPDKDGQLLARTADGKVHEILSGDVRLAEKT